LRRDHPKLAIAGLNSLQSLPVKVFLFDTRGGGEHLLSAGQVVGGVVSQTQVVHGGVAVRILIEGRLPLLFCLRPLAGAGGDVADQDRSGPASQAALANGTVTA